MSVDYLPAVEFPVEILLGTFNAAFDDYLVPLQLDDVAFMRMNAQNGINLEASCLIAVDDEAAGIGFLGQRDQRGWIGGVGVRPEFRRRGLGRGLIDTLLDTAYELDMETVQLEVIEGNEAAYKLYLDLDFDDVRRLLIVGCEELPAFGAEVAVEVVPGRDVLAHYDQFHIVRNPWQREQPSLAFIAGQAQGWQVQVDGVVKAYALGAVKDEMVSFMDVAFAPGAEEVFMAMMVGIHRQHPEAICRMVNLAEDDPAWPLLAKIGYEEQFAQHEMLYTFE